MIGQTISHYTILEKLGEGGMGVVYKARDTKLDRDVALKFLPAHLTASGNDRARFIQEAKAAAALSHPNVLSVIDIQEQPVAATQGGEPENRIFIVMDFVDGQTLREKKESLSFKQAAEIAIQVADGLAAAHEKGIVHRDIKPENVMVRRDGIAQIMDFGLAKLRGNVTKLTREGSTVGTAGYMSPEQVQGQDTDHRSDIFSLGVVMYELFTGRTPFKAAHETALMYEIVNVNPEPMSATKPDLDPELDRIVLGCLEKDPNDRTQSAKQVSIDLKRFRRESGRQSVSRITASRPAMQAGAGNAAPKPGPAATDEGAAAAAPASRPMVPWLVAALLFVALAAATWLWYGEAARPVPVFTASIMPPPGIEYILQDGGHFAVSPDGTMLVYAARDSSGKVFLWIRELGAPAPRQLAETEGAEYPFWSPDSRHVGYFVPGKLKKILASGGPSFTICDAPSGRGGSWNDDDVIIFSPAFDRTGIHRVQASGGPVTPVTKLDTARNMSNGRWPNFLPDGKHFIYTTQAAKRSSDFSGALYVASLDGSLDKHLLDVSTNTEYRDGRLIYVRQDALVAQEFDAGSLELSGDAYPVVDKVGYAPNRSRGVFSTSLGGVLVYLSVSGQGRTLSWLDRKANDLVPVGSGTIDNNAVLTDDESKVVFDDYEAIGKNFDIWSYDLARGVRSRLTFDPADDSDPVVSRDGNSLVFTTWKDGNNMSIKDMSGSGTPSVLHKSVTSALATDWTADGKYIVFQDVESTADFDLWYLRVDSGRTAQRFLRTEFTEEYARFSPDGRWLAYHSDESGRPEIYVKPFPWGDGKWQISTSGGYRAVWGRNGKTLYYSSEQGMVMTSVDGTGPVFTVGSSTLIFRHPAGANLRLHGVTKDGSRLLVSHLTIGRGVTPLTLLTDWRTNLEKR